MSKADKRINKLEQRNETYNNSQTCNVDNKNPHINDPAIYIYSDSDKEQQLNTTQSITTTYSTEAIDTKVMSSLHRFPNTGLLKRLHLPENFLETLLNIFNYIWTTGKFPDDWQYATTIPIPKPGKDPAEPNNYRPIALTSCLCKHLEE